MNDSFRILSDCYGKMQMFGLGPISEMLIDAVVRMFVAAIAFAGTLIEFYKMLVARKALNTEQ